MKTAASKQTGNANVPAPKWNLKLGRFLGIDVYLHFTFLLILGLLAVAHWMPGRSVAAALGGVIFCVAIFLCVLAHEFGHALAARRFGVGTRDITLLPVMANGQLVGLLTTDNLTELLLLKSALNDGAPGALNDGRSSFSPAQPPPLTRAATPANHFGHPSRQPA